MILLINGIVTLVFILAAFGQLTRIEPVPGVAFYAFEPILLLAVVLLMVRLRRAPAEGIRLHQLSAAVALFLCWVGITLLLSWPLFVLSENILAAFYFIRIMVYLLFLVFWFAWCLRGYAPRSVNRNVIMATTALVVISGLGQYFLYPNLRNLSYLGWDPHEFRVFGVYLEPVIYASISGVLLLTWFGFPPFRIRVVRMTVQLIVSGLFIATFSRAAYLGIAVSGMFSLKKKLIVPLLTAFIGMALILALLPKPGGEGVNLLRTSTIVSRSADYQQAWNVIVNHPVIGIGYNHIGAIKKVEANQLSSTNHAAASFHSTYLIVLATSGLIGLGLFLNLLYFLGKVHSGLAQIVVFLGVIALLDNVLLHSFVWVAIALVGGYLLTLPSYKSA